MTSVNQWLTVEQARDRILARVSRLPAEETPILEAQNQVLAEALVAQFSIPPLTNTAMDGYALQAASTSGASESTPVDLRVVGELAAGYVYSGSVGAGEAVRIMTGAPIPDGADAVVPFEETDEDVGRPPQGSVSSSGSVRVLKPAQPGANLRYAGEDVREGQVVLEAGRMLGPMQIGVAASLGSATVKVYRRPVVAILATGDELLEPGDSRRPGTIYDSNSYMVSALVAECGAIPRRMGIARDTIEAVTERLREAVATSDMVITSAGVSRGDFDVVKEVLAREGDVDFWLVKMRPGKPLAFGSFEAPGGRQVPHLGLPGNPVSSAVTFELFGRPAIDKAMGRSTRVRDEVEAVSDDRIAMVDDRRFYARVRLRREPDGWHAALTGAQGSGVLTSMAEADGLVVVPEGLPDVQPGDRVRVMVLR
jgi:molybdopterin molybdotransferase